MIRDTSGMDELVERPRGWNRRIVLGVAAGVVVAVAALALLGPLLGRWSEADRSVDRGQLRIATVTRGELVHDVAVQGKVVAASRPTVYSPSSGIVSVRVREGERIGRGEILAVVESPELENRLEQERATLAALTSEVGRRELGARQQTLANRQDVELREVRVEAARRALERAQELDAEGLTNAVELEQARDTLTIESMELAQAREKVELEKEMLSFELADARSRRDRQALVVRDVERQVGDLRIRTPVDGIVATVAVEDRDAVVRGQAVAGVVDLSELEVEVSIPETYADDVAPGVAAVVVVDGREAAGTLTRVAPEVRNSQVAGRIAFADGVPEGLRQNQRVSTRLLLDRRENALILPRGPFLESGGGRRVWVVANGLARARAVELGAVSVSQVEVVSGLEEGEEVVISDTTRFEGAATVLLRR